jgi:hypothetical protein
MPGLLAARRFQRGYTGDGVDQPGGRIAAGKPAAETLRTTICSAVAGVGGGKSGESIASTSPLSTSNRSDGLVRSPSADSIDAGASEEWRRSGTAYRPQRRPGWRAADGDHRQDRPFIVASTGLTTVRYLP